MKLGPTAVKAQSPNHWTAREFPALVHFQHFVGYLTGAAYYARHFPTRIIHIIPSPEGSSYNFSR